VPYADLVLVRGRQTNVFTLNFRQPGNYEISVIDLKLGRQPLGFLSFDVFGKSVPDTEPVVGSGTLALYISAAGKNFLRIRASAARSFGYGLYAFHVVRNQDAPVVPLPATLLLLLSGLVLLVAVRRRGARKREIEIAAPQFAAQPA
jgi:hypothetical protein